MIEHFEARLVRDKIPEVSAEAAGEFSDTQVLADDDLYHRALSDRLLEEAQLYVEYPDIEGLADITDVIEALAGCACKEISMPRIQVLDDQQQAATPSERLLREVLLFNVYPSREGLADITDVIEELAPSVAEKAKIAQIRAEKAAALGTFGARRTVVLANS